MKNKLVIAIVLGVALAAVAWVVTQGGDRLHAKARKHWKDNAVAEIARQVGDQKWLAAETNVLAAKAAKDPTESDAWLAEHLILMKSGEWIAYASECSKNNRWIHDIFLGRASDGKWYYSTYHFCIGMLELKMEEQPETLSSFAKDYFLRDFDGRSDVCLELTWPPKHE